jgi:hypothetical protein
MEAIGAQARACNALLVVHNSGHESWMPRSPNGARTVEPQASMCHMRGAFDIHSDDQLPLDLARTSSMAV